MANKIQVKMILELRSKNMSRNSIALVRGMSRTSVSEVIKVADQLGITFDDIKDKNPETVYSMFFPDRHSVVTLFETLRLCPLRKQAGWGHTQAFVGRIQEQMQQRRLDSCGYTKYCKEYQDHTMQNQLTSHLTHKPGNSIEVGWSGPTMSYVVRSTGEVITVFLFVGTPSLQSIQLC